MTLLKLVMDSDRRYLKIAAKDGSQFFYCGTKEDFMENYSDYNKDCKAEAIFQMKKAKDRLKNLLKKGASTVADYAGKHPGECSVEGYMEYLRSYFSAVVSTEEKRQRRKEYLENYKRLQNREVVESFPASEAIDEDCLVVYIEGNEVGKYWDLAEQDGKPHLSFSSGETEEG